MKMRTIKQIVITLTATIFFIGCSSHTAHFSPFISAEIDFNKNSSEIIIHEFITIVKAYYPPAKTIFQIEPTSSIFSKNIESELRKKGYGFEAIYGKGIKSVPLAWRISYLNKKMISVSYNIGDASISRIYKLNQNRYQPFNSFSAVGLDKIRFSNLNFTLPTTQEQSLTLSPQTETIYEEEMIPLYEEETSTISQAKVIANSLKIRSKPNTNSEEIDIIKQGESISYSEIVLDNNNEEWVKLEGGGYMKASYLEL